MKTDLRLTDTNAASDSKGRTWGLEGGLFWWLVGGVGAGITVFCVCLFALALPFTPVARHLGFEPLPLAFAPFLLAITGGYLLAVEGVKRWFFRGPGRV